VQDQESQSLYVLFLEDLVPDDNFYRQVEQCSDFGFVRDLVRHLNSDFTAESPDETQPAVPAPAAD
jgi:hypothetical protein